MRQARIALLIVLGLTGVGRADWVTATLTADTAPSGVAVNPVTNRIYVANYGGGSVTVIDGNTNATANVEVGAGPEGVAVNPVTNQIYVGNVLGNSVTRIDGATNATTTIAVGTAPEMIAVNTVTNRIYVANALSDNVTVIDGATDSTTTVAVGGYPDGVAVNPVTNQIYVANQNSNDITVIDGATNGTRTIPGGSGPWTIAVNPVTNRIYVANRYGGDVTVIDGATDSTTSVTVGSWPFALSVNPVTNKIYVANNSSSDVTIIDGATNGTTTVGVGASPSALGVNPVLNRIYVTVQGADSLAVIDGVTDGVSFLGTGNAPRALAVNPVTGRVYVGNWSSWNITVLDGAAATSTTVTVGPNPMYAVVNPVTNKVYVTNYAVDYITIVDGVTGDTAGKVQTGANPLHIVVNPVTNKVYVSNIGCDSVTVIDGATNATVDLPTGPSPYRMGVNTVTNKIYVPNYQGKSVTVIDGATNGLTTVPVQDTPCVVAVNPATNKVYVANHWSASVTVIDGATNDTHSIAVGTRPNALVVNPHTNKVYVANWGSGTVTIINGATEATTTVAAGSAPYEIAFNPVTNKVYVADGSGSSVTVIDGVTDSTSTIATTAFGMAVAVNPMTDKVYVSNEFASTVTVIDGVSNAVLTLPTGGSPYGLAVNPVTGDCFVPNYTSGTVTIIRDGPVTDTRVRAFASAPTTTSSARPIITGKGVNRSSPGRTKMLAVGNRLNTAQKVWNPASILTGAGTDSLTWLFNWGSDSLIAGENFIVLQPLESDAGTTNNHGLGTPFAGNRTVVPVYRVPSAVPPESTWVPEPPPPLGEKNKKVSDGGALATLQGNGDTTFSYLLKGNNTCEFYRYNSATRVWTTLESIPRIGSSSKKKGVKKGATLVAANGRLYATKGNKTSELWVYTPALSGTPTAGSWGQLTNIPGTTYCGAGTSTATVTDGTSTYIYLLKANNTFEFYRYNQTANTWATMPNAPGGPLGKTYKAGSAIVYYPDEKDGMPWRGRIYAVKGGYNEYYAFTVPTGPWVAKTSLPQSSSSILVSKTKCKAGTGLAYCDRPSSVLALKGGSRELWKYDALADVWARGPDVPAEPSGKKVGAGGAINCINGIVYITKGNKTSDFYSLPLAKCGDGFSRADATQGNSSPDGRRPSLSVAPNPFTSSLNPSISYSLSVPGNVSLKLYDVTGKLVSTLASGYHPAGAYSSQLTANSSKQRLAAGIYVLRFDSDGYSTTEKLIIE